MLLVQRSILVGFNTELMYQLVNDIDTYPQFLPGCLDSKIISQDDQSMTAFICVDKAGVRNHFTTCNTLYPHERIEMDLIDGPFKYFKGNWSFHSLDREACKVMLDLKFEFSSRFISVVFGKIFQELTSNMVQAFSERAKQVYIS